MNRNRIDLKKNICIFTFQFQEICGLKFIKHHQQFSEQIDIYIFNLLEIRTSQNRPFRKYNHYHSVIIFLPMASIIDVLFDSGLSMLKTHPKYQTSVKTQNIQKPPYQLSHQYEQHQKFLINGLHKNYDLLFQTKFTQNHTSVDVFLISKFGDILKSNSQISRIELLQKCFNQKEFYSPCINPITGFLYFKIDFFNLGNENLELQGQKKADWILKVIEIQKLIFSIDKISGIQNSQEKENYEGWYTQEHQQKLSLAKAIAGSIMDPNFQILFSRQQKFLQNRTEKLKNLKTKYLQSFLESSIQKKVPIQISRIKQQIKQVQKVHPHLSTFIKKKSRRTNYDLLYLNVEKKGKINEQIKQMWMNKSGIQYVKVNEEFYGNITLKLQRLDSLDYNKRLTLFGLLSKNHQYDQIQKYFNLESDFPIQVILEAKGDNMQRFLEKNGTVISLETKMRLLIQIYTFVNVMWEENELIFSIDNLKNILITKKLGIKIRGLENFFRSDKQMAWEDFDIINKKRSESILNLSSLFFKLFYRVDILYARPTTARSPINTLFDESKLNGIEKMSIYNSIPKEVTGKTKDLLTSLNYIFSEQIYAAKKIFRKLQRKEMMEGLTEEPDFMKAQYFQQSTDCSDGDGEGEESSIQGILSTSNIASWLMKSF